MRMNAIRGRKVIRRSSTVDIFHRHRWGGVFAFGPLEFEAKMFLLWALFFSFCGSVLGQPRIIGGVDAYNKDYPFMAFLRVRTDRIEKPISCGGSILNEQWIISAAHCSLGDRKASIKVILGVDNLRKRAPLRETRGLFFHTNYVYDRINAFKNDLLLIKLREPITFDDKIKPIALPEKGEEKLYKEVEIVGWGATRSELYFVPSPPKDSSQLQMTTIGMYDDDYCYKKSRDRITYRFNKSMMICAGVEGDYKDNCQGDSGGPLVARRVPSRQPVVLGLVSFGFTCGRPDKPAYFTRVSAYLDWIERTIKNN